MAKEELRLISASGILGYGFPEASLARGMERKPDVIGCDAGSTDAGPYYLGSGTAFVSRASCKRDTELLLKAARKANVPLLLGSAGGAGGEAGLQFLVDIVKEIARENGLHFKLAMIHSEQEKGYLKVKLRQGKIISIGTLPELTEKDIDDAEHIVGVMGVEPFNKALDMGAEVVVAGRSSDTSIFAAVPVRYGFDSGLAWHAGKILECGAASAQPVAAGDCILVTMRKDHFLVEPMNPQLRHTTLSVAAHALYENPSPYHLYEPGGMLDLTNASYEQYNERTVKVSGSKFVRSRKYYVKLESAALIGYRTITIMGTRDPVLIGQIDDYLGIVRNTVRGKVSDAFKGKVSDSDYILNFRVYGQHAVMGDWEPVRETRSHELGIVIEVIARDQELSKAILALARTFTLHNHFPGRLCIAGNMAVAFSPSDIPMGPVYRFNMDHLVEVDDPCEMFEVETVAI